MELKALDSLSLHEHIDSIIYEQIPLIRNPESWWGPPALWASMKPAPLKQVGKSETLSDQNPCSWHSTVQWEGILQLSAFPWGGKELAMSSTFQLFWGMPKILLLSHCSQSADGTWHILGTWELVRAKMVVWIRFSSNHHNPSLRLLVEETGEKRQVFSFSLGREQVRLHVQIFQIFYGFSNGLASVLPVLEHCWSHHNLHLVENIEGS